MSAEAYHVVSNPEGGWNVIKGGSKRATKRFDTKDQAVSWGLLVSKREGSEFVIHKKDGTIERKDSHV